MEKMRRIENSLIKSTTQELEKMSIDSKGNKLDDKMFIDSKDNNHKNQKTKEELEKIKENDRKRIR